LLMGDAALVPHIRWASIQVVEHCGGACASFLDAAL
jgi:hypothetical protein